QTHLGCLPATLAMSGAALLLLVPRLRAWVGLPPRPALPRGPLIAAAALLALVWAPPVVEQLSPGGGNLAHIAGFSAYFGGAHPAGEPLGAVGAAAAGWLLGLREARAALALLPIVVALAVAHAGARRSGRALPGALSLVTLAGLAAALLSAARV